MMPRSPRVIREEGRVASAWALSIVGHLVALGLGGLLVAASLGRRTPAVLPPPAPPPSDDTVEIELPVVVDGSQLGVLPPELPSQALARGGGEAMPRLDSGHAGRGGTDTSPTPAINLADRDDELLLSPEVMSRLDRTQIQRLRSARRRASREDWRASREPMELTFLAEGRGDHLRPEHRRPGAHDPSAGGRAWGAVAREGGALGAAELPPGFGERARLTGGPVEGMARASSGRGVRDGAPGEDHRDSALVAHARPMVNQGTPSVPADVRDRPSDNVDAEQEVATRMQSILHASNAGGRLGPGTGGQAGLGPAGSGGLAGAGIRGARPGHGAGLRPRRRPARQAPQRLPAPGHRQGVPAHGQRHARLGGRRRSAGHHHRDLHHPRRRQRRRRRRHPPQRHPRARRELQARHPPRRPAPPAPPELGPTFRWAMPLDFRNQAVRHTIKAEPSGG